MNRGDDASRAQNIFFRIFINVSPRRGATRSTLALDAAPPRRDTPRPALRGGLVVESGLVDVIRTLPTAASTDALFAASTLVRIAMRAATARPLVVNNGSTLRARARGCGVAVRAGEGVSRSQEYMGGLGGDFGARDATAGEIESGFTETSLGHADTDHILKVPKQMADMIMLLNKTCGAAGQDEKLAFGQQEVYRKQVWDWKIRPGKGNFECLRRELATREGEAENLAGTITALCSKEGWEPAFCAATSGTNVLVELGTAGVKGITTNDFILAAKIDANKEVMSMVVKAAPKARNWI